MAAVIFKLARAGTSAQSRRAEMRVTRCIVLSVVALGSGLCPGCVSMEEHNKRFAAALWTEWQGRKAAAAEENKELEEALESIETHETRLDDLEEQLGTAGEDLRLTVATLTIKVDEYEGRHLGIPKAKTVKDFVSAEVNALGESLRQSLGAKDDTLDTKVVEAVGRIETLEKAQESASARHKILWDDLKSGLKETRDEIKHAIEGVRSDMGTEKTLKDSVDVILGKWKRNDDIDDLKTQSDEMKNLSGYVLPGIIVIATALLGNAGLALRPRYRKEIEDALRTAQTAENAAQAAVAVSAGARESVEAALAELSRPRKGKAREPQKKEQKPTTGLPGA